MIGGCEGGRYGGRGVVQVDCREGLELRFVCVVLVSELEFIRSVTSDLCVRRATWNRRIRESVHYL